MLKSARSSLFNSPPRKMNFIAGLFKSTMGDSLPVQASRTLGPQPVKCEELVTSIKAHKFACDPNKVWDMIKVKAIKEPVEPMALDTPIFEDKVRFVCISDTHSRTDQMKYEVPPGDILIHTGDFTNLGRTDELKKFSEFLKSLDAKFRYKVAIAGNHELSFDPLSRKPFSALMRLADDLDTGAGNPRDLVTNCIYLEESMIELFGIKIYGSPYQPRFGDWAFNVDRGEDILMHWNKIPDNTDVLLTHGPALGYGDRLKFGGLAGCSELLTTITDRVRPKYHIFGHIHEDYGMWTNGTTTFINASTVNVRMRAENPPVIFDIELPDGVTKSQGGY